MSFFFFFFCKLLICLRSNYYLSCFSLGKTLERYWTYKASQEVAVKKAKKPKVDHILLLYTIVQPHIIVFPICTFISIHMSSSSFLGKYTSQALTQPKCIWFIQRSIISKNTLKKNLRYLGLRHLFIYLLFSLFLFLFLFIQLTNKL